MTDTFWITATVLILLALAFVLYPVFFHRPQARKESDLKHQNLLAYKTRLQELDDELEAGILDEQAHRQLKEELAGAMLDDMPENAEPVNHKPGRRSALAVAVFAILVLPVGGYLGYQQWGALDQVEQYLTMQEMDAAGGDQAAKVAELAEQLRSRMEASPDNPDGWAMLGQTYMRIERYQDAAWAFRKLAQAVTDDPNSSAVAYGLAAQALFFATEGELTADVEAAINAAQSLNPDEVNSLGLLGINAFSRQEYQAAIEYWEKIVAVAPDHPQIESIRGGIEESYRRLGETPPAAASNDAVNASEPGPGVSIELLLDEAFEQQVSDDTTLFIFARPSRSAQGAPVAVARLTAGDLPTELRLDDRYAMSPEATISAEDEVLVIARLSLSGGVNPQPGDLQGRVLAKVTSPELAGEPVRLVIDQQLTN